MPLVEHSRLAPTAKHNGGGGWPAQAAGPQPAFLLPSQEISLYRDLVTTTPSQTGIAPALKEKKKKRTKSKKHRTGLCGLSRAAPGGYLASTHCGQSGFLCGCRRASQGVGLASEKRGSWPGEAGTGAPGPGGGWALHLALEGWGGGQEEQEDCSLRVLRTCSGKSVTPLPGGQRRQRDRSWNVLIF